ncbi:MAG: glutathione S-transferase [Pseudomonadota bacterium]|nr:glutathione S-transferase [Pseudomonadota bacterium]
MLTLHFLEKSRAHRVLWLLEEAKVPYELKAYKRGSDMLAGDDLKAIHPLGKSPVITDEVDGKTITVAESGAVIEYIIDQYAPQFKPEAGTEARRQYTFWLHYSEGTLMSFLMLAFIFQQIGKTPMPFFVRPIATRIVAEVNKRFLERNITSNAKFIENHLAVNEWFAGDQLTGADFQMCYPIEGMVDRVTDVLSMPNSKKYIDRLRAMPSYQKALEIGGPILLDRAGENA